MQNKKFIFAYQQSQCYSVLSNIIYNRLIIINSTDGATKQLNCSSILFAAWRINFKLWHWTKTSGEFYIFYIHIILFTSYTWSYIYLYYFSSLNKIVKMLFTTMVNGSGWLFRNIYTTHSSSNDGKVQLYLIKYRSRVAIIHCSTSLLKCIKSIIFCFYLF